MSELETSLDDGELCGSRSAFYRDSMRAHEFADKLSRLRTYAQTLRDQTGDSEMARAHRAVGAVLENIIGN